MCIYKNIFTRASVRAPPRGVSRPASKRPRGAFCGRRLYIYYILYICTYTYIHTYILSHLFARCRVVCPYQLQKYRAVHSAVVGARPRAPLVAEWPGTRARQPLLVSPIVKSDDRIGAHSPLARVVRVRMVATVGGTVGGEGPRRAVPPAGIAAAGPPTGIVAAGAPAGI